MLDWSLIREKLKGLQGIEIGGPTALFKEKDHHCLLYDILTTIDGINKFQDNPFQNITSNQFESLPSKVGIRYNADATSAEDLGKIDKRYDVLFSSHVIEHIANPIKALQLWKTLIKPGGFILVLAPEKSCCFDSTRDYTEFSHIVKDCEEDMGESDLSHLKEIIDKKAQPPAFPGYGKNSLNNLHTRVIHHHVFDVGTLRKTCEYAGYKTIAAFNHSSNKLQNVYLGSL